MMLLLTGIILCIVGYLMLWQVRNILEDQFGYHLLTVSNLVRKEISAEKMQMIEKFGTQSRTYLNLKNQIQNLKSETGLRRIFIFNQNWQSLADTEDDISFGHFYYDLFLDKNEIQKLATRNQITSTLFQDNQGRLFKRAYTQVENSEPKFIIGIEATTEALNTWRDIRSTYFFIAILIIILSFISAYFFTKSIIVPVRSLVELTDEIKKGNLKQKIELKNNDEIGQLAQSMEKMRQSILRRNEQQKTVLAGIAHEIRNPLGGIEMYASIILNESKDEALQKYSRRILQESQQMQKILKEFNEYGRPILPECKSCSLPIFIKETQELLQTEIEKKSLRITIHSNQKQYYVMVDPGHLRQILLNLLCNAIQFSPKDGEIILELNEEKHRVVLDLIDHGPGIANNKQEKIFEPFYSTEKNHTGLGLSIIKNLIEENRGEVFVIISENGAHFRVIFKK